MLDKRLGLSYQYFGFTHRDVFYFTEPPTDRLANYQSMVGTFEYLNK